MHAQTVRRCGRRLQNTALKEATAILDEINRRNLPSSFLGAPKMGGGSHQAGRFSGKTLNKYRQQGPQ